MPADSSRPYTIRPFSSPARSDYKDTFRVYLAPSALLLHKLKPGDAVSLWPVGNALSPALEHMAIAWTAHEKIADSIVQTSKPLQDIYGFHLGDKVHLSKCVGDIPVANTVFVQPDQPISAEDITGWEWFLEYPLAEHMVTSFQFAAECRGEKRLFTVTGIESDGPKLNRFSKESVLKIRTTEIAPSARLPLQITEDVAGGLGPQIAKINKLLSAFNTNHKFSLPKLGGTGGILLYGSSGTGKTLLLNAIAATAWGKVYRLDQSVFGKYVGETEQTVRTIFANAVKTQPSIVIIDELDSFASRRNRSDNDHKLVSTLVSLMGGEGMDKVLIVAATSRPNDVDPALRRPGRFESEIEIPIPDAKARREIITTLATGLDLSEELVSELAARTHGYVGADLQALLKKAAIARITSETIPEGDALPLASEDIDSALALTRPTAMREIFLEPPTVHWSDIGGGEVVKTALQEAVSWPLKHPELMESLGITARTGVLLYGPPGCSKTLTAQALATESGLNFIAIKGAELVNQYVGESERAVREVFRKAREASPSIIFFDEIDAIAKSRDGGSSHGGLNILTTLLNEMDGIEPLKGVIVLAATNKPSLLDPALMRPGRLESLLYVGLPDLPAREQILRIRTRKMPLAEDVNLVNIAERTLNFSGAEIVNICEKAGREAMRRSITSGSLSQISAADFEASLKGMLPGTSGSLRRELEGWALGRSI